MRSTLAIIAWLADDHANARVIAERIAGLAGIRLDLAAVQSNIVIWEMADGAPDAAAIVARAKAAGVLISALGARTVRAVTHLDVSGEQCRRAAEIIEEIVGGKLKGLPTHPSRRKPGPTSPLRKRLTNGPRLSPGRHPYSARFFSRYFCSPDRTSSFFWLCTVTATVTTPVVRCGVSAATVRLG